MQDIINQLDPIFLAALFGSLTLFVGCYYGYQMLVNSRHKSDVQKRLDTKKSSEDYQNSASSQPKGKVKPNAVAKKMAQKTNEFYSTSDPDSLRQMQLRLIQAGYLNPGAVGYFLSARFAAAALGFVLAVLMILTVFADLPFANRIIIVVLGGTVGYFVPNFFLNTRINKLREENRGGFPDVMDLMVVAAEAGLTTEASIERIAKEIQGTYPTLSAQLNIVALEIRAGRPIDQALHAFGERLGLEEIKGFATMVQQSKELGTSVSDALRVYSDEMRHKRMMKAEEKAYALPAKMSIPVTVFILPIVIGVAIIPTVVRLMTDNY